MATCWRVYYGDFGTIAAADADSRCQIIPPLALQLRDVDVHAALLGDGLDRSREIGIAQQFLVAQSANGCPGGLRHIENKRDRVQRAQQTHHDQDHLCSV